VEKQYYVYMTASISKVLYVGVTNDLVRRIWEHKEKLVSGFTDKYNVNRLVYFEVGVDALGAIAREKQIKAYRREKKVALIEALNPGWKDLYHELTG
jgi:putative endonuclease